MKDTCTIVFTGDIMCNMAQLDACRTVEGYNFSPVFEKLGGLFEGADYVVGNLETPISPDDTDLSSRRYNFNTPHEFLDALKEQGFDFFSTANNHSVDRNIKGVIDTLDMLDQWGFGHTGTARSEEERLQPAIREICGIKVGFVNYTYGINAFFNKGFIRGNNRWAVNLLMPPEEDAGSIHLQAYHSIGDYVKEFYDPRSATYRYNLCNYITRIEEDIRRVKDAGAEYVIFLLHSGGQYNPEPEEYTLYIARKIREMGVDLIVGHHPHRIHRTEFLDGCPVLYSLGNFTFTPAPDYGDRKIVCPEADYSTVIRVCLKRKDGRISMDSMQFSVCKSIIGSDGTSVVWPVTKLYEVIRDAEAKAALLKDVQTQAGIFCPSVLRSFTLRDWYDFPVQA